MHKVNPIAYKAMLRGSTDVRNVDNVTRSVAGDVSERAMQRYVQASGSARRAWFTCLANYFLRANEATASEARPQLEEILGADNPDASHAIGVPIRPSGKCRGNSLGELGEMACWSLERIFNHVHHVAFGRPTISRAVIAI